MMKKYLIPVLLGSFLLSQKSRAQCNTLDLVTPEFSFSGMAPSPWAINGQIADWTTILGQFTGNNSDPFNPASSSVINYSEELTDRDSPAPKEDLRFTSMVYDSKNIYFYVRRAQNGGPSPAFFYFIDINRDGYMSDGEPVIGGKFLGGNTLTLYSFKTNTTAPLYVAGKGNPIISQTTGFFGLVDGYTVKGTTEKIFDESNPNTLLAGEVFSSKSTEGGYGVEFAIPWRFLKNWINNSGALSTGDLFTYHVSSQLPPNSNNYTYDDTRVADNMGSCCKRLNYSILPKMDYKSKTTIAGRIVTFRDTIINNSPVPVNGGIANVSINNVTGNFTIFDGSYVQVLANGSPLSYLGEGAYPGIYVYGIAPRTSIPPFSQITIELQFILPAASPVTGYKIDFDHVVNRFTNFDLVYCRELFSLLGGIEGGNPKIILDVTTENRNRRNLGAETIGADQFSVYPNPSKGSVYISLPGTAKGSVRIEDMNGRLVNQTMATGSNLTIDGLRTGFYLVRFISADGKQYQTKLVVN